MPKHLRKYIKQGIFMIGADGRVRPGFQWTDADDQRTQQDALEAEGVSFEGDVASISSRLSIDELEQLLQIS